MFRPRKSRGWLMVLRSAGSKRGTLAPYVARPSAGYSPLKMGSLNQVLFQRSGDATPQVAVRAASISREFGTTMPASTSAAVRWIADAPAWSWHTSFDFGYLTTQTGAQPT